MTTVRMTPSLQSQIISNVENKFNQRIQELTTSLKKNARLAAKAYELALGSHYNEFVKLSREHPSWYPETGSVRANIIAAYRAPDAVEDTLKNHMLDFSIDPPRPAPYSKVSQYSATLTEVPRLNLRDLGFLEEEKTLQEIISLNRARNHTQKEVSQLLATAPNLKRLLEAWPAALQFCPDWAIQQHNRPIQRRAKDIKQELEQVKLSDQVNINLLKVRL